jgi:ribosomal protein L19
MYFSAKESLQEFYMEASFFKRGIVDGFKNAFFIFAGDVLKVFFFKKGSPFIFEGVGLGVNGKRLKRPDSSFVLRNFIQSVGIECFFFLFL